MGSETVTIYVPATAPAKHTLVLGRAVTAINRIGAARRALLAGLVILLPAGCSDAPGGEQVVFSLNSGFTTGLSGQTSEVQDIGMPLGWLYNATSEPVRLISVQFAPRPASLHVLNVYAYSYRENPNIGIISELGVLPEECPREFRPHPLSAAVFPPHSNGYWEVIIAFTISRPGVYHLSQVRLDYTTQGHRGWQYQNIFATVTVKNPRSPARAPCHPRPSAEADRWRVATRERPLLLGRRVLAAP